MSMIDDHDHVLLAAAIVAAKSDPNAEWEETLPVRVKIRVVNIVVDAKENVANTYLVQLDVDLNGTIGELREQIKHAERVYEPESRGSSYGAVEYGAESLPLERRIDLVVCGTNSDSVDLAISGLFFVFTHVLSMVYWVLQIGYAVLSSRVSIGSTTNASSNGTDWSKDLAGLVELDKARANSSTPSKNTSRSIKDGAAKTEKNGLGDGGRGIGTVRADNDRVSLTVILAPTTQTTSHSDSIGDFKVKVNPKSCYNSTPRNSNAVVVYIGDEHPNKVDVSVQSTSHHDATVNSNVSRYEFIPHRMRTVLEALSTMHTRDRDWETQRRDWQQLPVRIQDVPVVSSYERNVLLNWSTAPTPEYDHNYEHTLHPHIHNYFESIARRKPDAIALEVAEVGKSEHSFIGYGELDERAEVVAGCLRGELACGGGGGGGMALLYFEKGVEMIVATLAILKANAAFVPLDTDHPPARTLAILDAVCEHANVHADAKAKFIMCLTSTALYPRISAIFDSEPSHQIKIKIIAIDALPTSLTPIPAVPGPASTSASGEDLCYIMFTSGSTGTPKGVLIPHSAVVSSVINGPPLNRELREEGGRGELRVLAVASCAFDYSIWDVFLPLTSGGRLCLAPKNTILDDLNGTLNEFAITFLETTPTILALVDPSLVPSLRTVYSSGEPLSAAILAKFTEESERSTGAPRIRFANGGAPTETTVMSLFTTPALRSSSDPQVLGTPFGSNRVYILHERGELAPAGTVGQIWIGGAQVGRGYIRVGIGGEGEGKFVFDRFSLEGRMYGSGDLGCWSVDGDGRGRVSFCGRAGGGGMVKVRGQRVELGEVESVLASFGGVKSVCVIKCVVGDGGREGLVGFVVLEKNGAKVKVGTGAGAEPETGDEGTSTITATAMKEFVASKLPRYMVPRDIEFLSVLPMTVNGKMDRRALEKRVVEMSTTITSYSPEEGKATHSPSPPTPTHSPIETLLRTAWRTTLDLPSTHSLPLSSDFYQLGGDSISVILVVAACRRAGYGGVGVGRMGGVRTLGEWVAVVEEAGVRVGLQGVGEEGRCGSEACRRFELVESAVREEVVSEMMTMGYSEADIQDAYPCTASVAGLISLAVAHPLSYFARYTFEKQAHFDPARMESAWRMLLRRHEILRTAFIVTADSVLHVILDEAAVDIGWTYQVFPNNEDRDSAVAQYLSKSQGFTLGRVPTRVALFESPTSSVLAWQVHHSQYDGWSFPLILRDLQLAYEMCGGGGAPVRESEASFTWAAPATPYSHFVKWNQSQDTAKALTYWSTHLADASIPSWPKVPLFNVRKRAVTDQEFVWRWSAGKALQSFCTAHHVTVSSFVRTVLGLALRMQESESADDVMFGVVTSGRAAVDVLGLEGIVGPTMATLPCRVDFSSPTASLTSILESVHEQSGASTPYEFLGLNEIINASAFAGSQDKDIFKVLLAMENLPGLYDSEDSFLGRNTRGHGIDMNYPLAIVVFPSPDNTELRFHFQWDSEYLSLADINWFQHHLLTISETMMNSPESSLSAMTFLSTTEQDFVLSAGKGIKPAQTWGSDPYFHTLVDTAASRMPSQIALQHTSGASITYSALVASANQAAHGLQRKKGVMHPDILVPVLFDKNANQIEAAIAFLAILKAGGAFVPLDSTWPAARLASCIKQTGSSFLICDAVIPHVARSLEVELMTVGDLAHDEPEETPDTPDLKADSMCYVMFTSGSTGQPKGVVIEHVNLMAYIENGSTVFPLSTVQSFLHFSPWTFDQGLADLFLAFPRGATINLANMDEMLLDITAVLHSTQTQYAVLTPAVAQLMKSGEYYPDLKTLVCGGEKMPSQLAQRWIGKLELIDAYGPTEATVHAIGASFKTSHYVPGVIGRPLGSTRAYIVDSSLRMLPIGATGELLLAGPQIARGYLGLPDETARAFIEDPFRSNQDELHGKRMYRTGDLVRWRSDGSIEYLGRQGGDGYVKLRGLRVDVGEIEATLMGVHKTIAVVQVVTTGDGRQHLLALVSRNLSVLSETVNISLTSDLVTCQPWVRTLVKTCRRILASYAVPTLWLALEAIPQAPSNKYDRKALRQFLDRILLEQPGRIEDITRELLCAQPPRAPNNHIERELHTIWCDILRLENISVHADFFSLGGDSISVIRVLSGLRQREVNITIQEFYESPTIASLAQVHALASWGISLDKNIQNSPKQPLSTGLVFQVQTASNGKKLHTPLWLLHCAEGVGHEYMNLANLGRNVFAISNPSKNRMSLEANYPDLESFTSRYMPLIPADEPVFIAGYSSGGLLALAIAARRRELGFPVKGLILLDTFNTEGWKFLGFAPDTDYGSNHISDAIDPSPKELQRAQERHTYNIIQAFVEPFFKAPALLIRAGIRETFREDEFRVKEGGDDDLNFFTRKNLPLLETVTIQGAEHADLVAYKDNFTTAVCQEVSDNMRDWCDKLDQSSY